MSDANKGRNASEKTGDPAPSLSSSHAKKRKLAAPSEEIGQSKDGVYEEPRRRATCEADLQGLVHEVSILRESLAAFLGAPASAAPPPPTPASVLETPGTTLQATTDNMKQSGSAGDDESNVWGLLYTQFEPAGTCFKISGDQFTIGRSTRCNVSVPDGGIPNFVGKFVQANGSTFLESLSSQEDALYVNGKAMRKPSKCVLRGGDEIVIAGIRSYAFSFEKVATVQTAIDDGAPGAATKRRERSQDADQVVSISSENVKRSKIVDDEVPPPRALPPPARTGVITTQFKRVYPKKKSKSMLNLPAAQNVSLVLPPPPPPKAVDTATLDKLVQEFSSFVLLPDDNASSFQDFPYHLEESMKEILLNTVHLFLKNPELVEYGANLQSLTPKILIDGPHGTELYQIEVVKALAAQYQVPLILLEASATSLAPSRSSDESGKEREILRDQPTRFKKGDRVRYNSEASGERGPVPGMTGEVILSFNEDNPRRVGVKFDTPIANGVSLGGLCGSDYGWFANTQDLRPESEDFTPQAAVSASIQALFKLTEIHSPCILLIPNVEEVMFQSVHRYKIFKMQLEKMGAGVVVIGCKTRTPKAPRGKLSDRLMNKSTTTLLEFSIFDQLRKLDEDDSSKLSKLLTKVLPTHVTIRAPQRNPALAIWKRQLEEDMKTLRLQSNRTHIQRLLKKNNVETEIENVSVAMLQKKMFSLATLERLVGWAIGRHLRDVEDPLVVDNKLQLGHHAIDQALSLQLASEKAASTNSLADVDADEFEKRILAEVVPAHELNVRFEDVGALEQVKETLKELVMLPLTRPELFRKGNLSKPCKGVLLFGPPGTGKTMLAKAVATECRANFINVSMASIGSKWFGEGEKYAKAVFTLAHKIAPSVIFIDEVDSILGKRERAGEHEAMRKIKNTLMAGWDGLKTQENERVIVLAATNRPFDLDDAVLRRLPRRLLVDLPDADNRAKILQVICKDEELVPGFDYQEVAKITEGFSGSDLKNLCIAASYMPIREILDQERAEGKDIEAQSQPDDPAIKIRALSFDDFDKASSKVSQSVSEDAMSISELRKWNTLYGEGGSREKSALSYYM